MSSSAVLPQEGTVSVVSTLIFDLLLIGLGALGIALYGLDGKEILSQRGFHCDDESLMLPYKSSSVPSWVNGLVGVFVPTIIVVANIFFDLRRRESTLATVRIGKCGFSFYKLFVDSALVLAPFFAGCSYQHIFTDIAKYQIGRLRPHFFHVCGPEFVVDGVSYNCSSSKLAPSAYIHEFRCTNQQFSENRWKESRVSFPSGHTSFISFAMTFAFLYIHFRLPRKIVGFLPRPLLQAACVWWAWFVAVSRIHDNKHHPTDVLSGGIIGVAVAVFFGFFVADLHLENKLSIASNVKDHGEMSKYEDSENENVETPSTIS